MLLNYHIGCCVLGSLCVGDLVRHKRASACNTDTTQNQLHQISNTQRTENTWMDILMSETCWAHKKLNKIASDIKLVFYSSTFTMMHGPINIRSSVLLCKLNQLQVLLCYDVRQVNH